MRTLQVHQRSLFYTSLLVLLFVNGVFGYYGKYSGHRRKSSGYYHRHSTHLYPKGFNYDTYSNCVTERTTAVCDRASTARYRTIDGTCNNLRHPTWGASKTALRRLRRASYVDVYSIDVPRGFPHTFPKVAPANEVSDKLFQVETTSIGNRKKLSTLFMTFGQFLDHDFTLVHEKKCKLAKGKGCRSKSAWKYPCFPILFNKKQTRCTLFGRSNPICKRRKISTRQQRNELSSFIDASQIYNIDKKHYEDLKKNDGSGQMKITKDGLLPINPKQKDCIVRGGCSLVGEERGDENVPLHAMHTLWLREHNRIARELKQINAHWSGQKIFDETRKIIGGVWQHIVYNEYIPELTKLPKYRGYNSRWNPSVTNAFATAAFRYGHSLIPNELDRLNNNFDVVKKPLSLQDAFNNRIPINDDGIEPFMFGLIGNESSMVDTKFAHGIARKLFILPGKAGHMDLLALNIQRGRDHGLPTYGAYRRLCGLPKIRSWSQLNRVMQRGAAKIFRRLYKHPYDIDLFAAGIAEKHAAYRKGGRKIVRLEVGPTFTCLFQHQFTAMRNGDRYFYKNKGVFTPYQLQSIQKVCMSTILCNNLKKIVSIQPSAFHVGENYRNRRISCSRIPKLSLAPWKEHRVVGDSEMMDESDLNDIIDAKDEEINDRSDALFGDEEEKDEEEEERGENNDITTENEQSEHLEDQQEIENEFNSLHNFYLDDDEDSSQNDDLNDKEIENIIENF